MTDAGINVDAVSSEAAADNPGSLQPSGRLAKLRSRAASAKRDERSALGAIARTVTEVQMVHTALELARIRNRARDIRRACGAIQPDLIHALRVPYEGLAALHMASDVPIVVSSWGLDFDLQASRDPVLASWMRRRLPRASGFQYDSPSDLATARRFGLRPEVPSLLAAGNFGISAIGERIPPPPDQRKLVVCARRPGPNIDTAMFLEAVERLLGESDLEFALVGAEKLNASLTRQCSDLASSGRLRLIGSQHRDEFLALMRSASVIVSPARADGTPNTVLEGLAMRIPVVATRLPQLEGFDPRLPLSLAPPVARELALSIRRAADTVPEAVPVEPRSLFPEWALYERNLCAVPELYRAVMAFHRNG